MVAIWKEEGRLLEMRAWVSSLADFEERLGWLTRVDSETWLDAMPAKVVKAADHDATVREMLKGIDAGTSSRAGSRPWCGRPPADGGPAVAVGPIRLGPG